MFLPTHHMSFHLSSARTRSSYNEHTHTHTHIITYLYHNNTFILCGLATCSCKLLRDVEVPLFIVFYGLASLVYQRTSLPRQVTRLLYTSLIVVCKLASVYLSHWIVWDVIFTSTLCLGQPYPYIVTWSYSCFYIFVLTGVILHLKPNHYPGSKTHICSKSNCCTILLF